MNNGTKVQTVQGRRRVGCWDRLTPESTTTVPGRPLLSASLPSPHQLHRHNTISTHCHYRPPCRSMGHFNFWLSLSLSETTLLFDLSLYLDRTLAQRKAKSKVKVAQCQSWIFFCKVHTSVVRKFKLWCPEMTDGTGMSLAVVGRKRQTVQTARREAEVMTVRWPADVQLTGWLEASVTDVTLGVHTGPVN